MPLEVKKTRLAEVPVCERSVPIDFEQVYTWFTGRIFPDKDCGETICGNHACCYPCYTHDGPTYLYYIPGELEFLKKKLGSRFPAREIGPNTGKYHCFGNSQCVYEYRPIDCRSYPYWPVVKRGELVAFIDDREPRCTIEEVPLLFFETVKKNWTNLLEIPLVRDWLEHEAPCPRGKVLHI